MASEITIQVYPPHDAAADDAEQHVDVPNEEAGEDVRRGSLESAPSEARLPEGAGPSTRSAKDLIQRVPLTSGELRVLSLNLGGRNTNPLEFQLRGDQSDRAVEAAAILRRAEKALLTIRDGPAAMLDVERALINSILADIFGDQECPAAIRWLFHCDTWAISLSYIKDHMPQFFNALNLSTLRLQRPSVWEDPASCQGYTTTEEYLLGWQEWYKGLWRFGQFWNEDAPRSAKKRHMDVPTCFAGLLLFDVMCLCSARCAMDLDSEQAKDGGRMPFKKIAAFASGLAASSLQARHDVAGSFIEKMEAQVLLVQEARKFADHRFIVDHFLPPFCALDGYTAVFLKKNVFGQVADISAAVSKKMEHLMDGRAAAAAQKAWRTTTSRLAAVHCRCHPPMSNFQVCLVSLHCSKSDHTASFLDALREVLADYPADINLVGLDSNCSGKDVASFQKRLWSSGFEIGCAPKQEQVTVVKQRTFFQTQVQKAGETDISHKDYIVSWGSQKARRAETIYTPDLRTPFGVEQETKQCVRLPTTRWPFDHCGVVASFQKRRSCIRRVLKSRQATCNLCLVFAVILLLFLPLVSTDRRGPYGGRGTWHHEGWRGTSQPAICKSRPPCQDGWAQLAGGEFGGACYVTTPKLNYGDAVNLCAGSAGSLVHIDSERENRLVTELCPDGDFCWIGLQTSRNSTQESWWDTGKPVNFTNLVKDPRMLFPLFPITRAHEYDVTALSNFPGEISGCYPALFVSGMDLPLLDLMLVAPAIGLAFSTIILILPQPPHTLTRMYLMAAFAVNLAWFTLRMLGSCFLDRPELLKLVVLLDPHVYTGGPVVTTMMAFWIIVTRMSLLYPAQAPRTIFMILGAVKFVGLAYMASFIDNTTTVDGSSGLLLFGFLITLLVILLYLLFGAVVASDLYMTWAFMKREAAIGRNDEGFPVLMQGVRAARIHLVGVVAAICSGALHWGFFLALVVLCTEDTYPVWVKYALTFSRLTDSITNDLCAHLLAVLHMDDAVISARGITVEVSNRARLEVQQHRLAVHVLKAAPTPPEQRSYLGELEAAARRSSQEGAQRQPGAQEEPGGIEPFLILKSAIRVETARIHRLMRCVRARAMTMPLRYQYLIDIPHVQGALRQHVPEHLAGVQSEAAAVEYFEWFYAQAESAQQLLFQQVKQLLAKFNTTPWPSDLGLVPEQFPWTIWPGGPEATGSRPVKAKEVISPGDILIHSCARTAIGRYLGRSSCMPCLVWEEHGELLKIHRCGAQEEEEVPRGEMLTCNGGGIFIPGPKKSRQRCRDKIVADYEGKEPWPAAASLTDVVRCMILLDDPYAVAVLVAYLRQNLRVVRVKNRFSEDALDPVGPEELQSMFYSASDNSEGSSSDSLSLDKQYRDILINVEVVTSSGVPFICEIQVTLSNLAILKKADQDLYTIRRMKGASELQGTFVFSGPHVASRPSTMSSVHSVPLTPFRRHLSMLRALSMASER